MRKLEKFSYREGAFLRVNALLPEFILVSDVDRAGVLF